MVPMTNTRTRQTVFLAFALYLILFTSFAVFHAYANNELVKTTCSIGLWVQHGQTAILSVVLISTALASLLYSNHFVIKAFDLKPFLSTASFRAPPLSPLL